ncbi:hypothetical protein [Parasitella parasitica]|uniref:Uncharacterized protein n=1 Tax=Parasitella parasitica TaxID=35722 RepID=A0A0B7NC39_9FUNG|nr:hypothetical protein [Parasitella parasitica]
MSKNDAKDDVEIMAYHAPNAQQTDTSVNHTTMATDFIQPDGHDNIQQDDDFGSFDGATDDDSFGSFDGQVVDDVDHIPSFNTLQDVINLWQHLLIQIYSYEAFESFRGASKSIRHYVLEDAPESLYSRLTWDSITRYTEDDTGIPKVKWHQSEIERLHLDALACKRIATPLISTPASLCTEEITKKPREIETMKPPLTTLIGSAPTPVTLAMASQTAACANNINTPPSEKRSSSFSISSLSKFLPHLSRTNLPKSPRSPTSPSQPLHQFSSKKSISHLNAPLKQDVSSSITRPNSVAFMSTQDIDEMSASSRKPTEQPRPVPQSMDLFDFTEDTAAIVKSPTHFQFSFQPLIPTQTIAPASVPTPAPASTRRNTIPANMHSEIKSKTPYLAATCEDEFGDFATEQDSLEDDFGDLKQETLQTAQEPFKSNLVNSMNEDPFGIVGYSYPNSISGCLQLPPGQQANNPIAIDDSIFSAKSTATASKTSVPRTFDAFSCSNNRLKTEKFTTGFSSITDDLFDMNLTFAKNDPDQNEKVTEDDDWGDWAY